MKLSARLKHHVKNLAAVLKTEFSNGSLSDIPYHYKNLYSHCYPHRYSRLGFSIMFFEFNDEQCLITFRGKSEAHVHSFSSFKLFVKAINNAENHDIETIYNLSLLNCVYRSDIKSCDDIRKDLVELFNQKLNGLMQEITENRKIYNSLLADVHYTSDQKLINLHIDPIYIEYQLLKSKIQALSLYIKQLDDTLSAPVRQAETKLASQNSIIRNLEYRLSHTDIEIDNNDISSRIELLWLRSNYNKGKLK